MNTSTPAAGGAALEAAGLAKVVVVYQDDHGHMRTAVYVMPREALAESLSLISEKAVG